MLKDSELWWNGASFLKQSLDPWTTEVESIVIDPLEERKSSHSSSESSMQENLILQRFSKLRKLLSFTSICIRFIVGLAKRKPELRELKLINLEFLDISMVRNDRAVKSALEMQNSRFLWISLNQRDIIPNKGHFIDLFVSDMHQGSLHGGYQLTLRNLRTTYWIVKGPQAMKRVITRFVICKRYNAHIGNQLMGDFPKKRVTPAFLFENAGVDYAGPFKVRLSKSKGRITTKGYACIFLCMSTKAVHIEVVEDYTSDAFIAAFSRFTSRRCHCATLQSDQGTNFVGADKELARLFTEASAELKEISSQLASLGTSWSFNPPTASHFGGLWEAAVKSAKYHLRRIVGEHVLTFVEYATLFCKIEACLNSRPLTTSPKNDPDFEILSPSHFLIQRPSSIIPEPTRTEVKFSYAKRWQWITGLAQLYWKLWSKNYLQSVQQRNKWQIPTESLKVGDIVLMKSNLYPAELL